MASSALAHMSGPNSQLLRVTETGRAPLSFFLDGVEVGALTGDTVLTAILTQQRHVHHSEFSGEPRAGFCLIGACQDCWVRCEDGARIRACSTLVEQGMRVVTNAVSSIKGGAR
ncbi:(2Fe-2S)-binding protein [Paraburkholderia diazotrophica]|uniref:2Fe-2S iron-sulfur cluster binding domain-containing protein n=1 Tax=Paraburkholderia diazotrophica TaxID=667676 RepID=A0A1H7EK53_9BURK|nr:(2Fe-2S)-binding protein [Paraburkholderia diazotrophica]SEK11065.1 2Fe-2S iron-sulfur cluster binding domain-containing protein [Paraburkholderia diazotrophica]